MIQIFNLYKTYKGNSQALIDISLEIKSGEFVFLTGSSGAGKSTLLKILYCWENFDKGQILINGMNIAKMREDNLYTLRRKIGVVFQNYRLLQRKTVFENVSFAQEAVESPAKKIRFKTWEALKKVGLTQKKDSFPLQLAGGEQQRVAIARSLVNSPEILLADEPTGNLDPDIALEILKLFEHANSQGVTVIFATHSVEMLKARNYRVISLSRGRLAST
jgi:cell division transport system ATP-binding protein